jgi:hypothetical protein
MRPCPLLDNPDAMYRMVKESGARSTDMEAPEAIDDLCAKTKEASEMWAAKSDPIWAEHQESKKRNNGFEEDEPSQKDAIA